MKFENDTVFKTVKTLHSRNFFMEIQVNTDKGISDPDSLINLDFVTYKSIHSGL